VLYTAAEVAKDLVIRDRTRRRLLFKRELHPCAGNVLKPPSQKRRPVVLVASSVVDWWWLLPGGWAQLRARPPWALICFARRGGSRVS